MPEKAEVRHTLSEQQARQLATVTKTVPDRETGQRVLRRAAGQQCAFRTLARGPAGRSCRAAAGHSPGSGRGGSGLPARDVFFSGRAERSGNSARAFVATHGPVVRE